MGGGVEARFIARFPLSSLSYLTGKLIRSLVIKPKSWDTFVVVKQLLPIEIDPEIMSGVAVFTGTRVPVETLFDYLMRGSNLDEFLECFPTVTRQSVLLVLDHYKHEAAAAA